MIDLNKEGEVFVLTMNDGENRWNTTFVRAFAEALDEVEGSEGPAALVATSATEKFFSNGLNLEWLQAEGEHRGGDRDAFGPDALEAGIVQKIEPLEALKDAAVTRAAELARLGENREVYGRMKEAIYGENAAINQPHGPAYMLKNPQAFH